MLVLSLKLITGSTFQCQTSVYTQRVLQTTSSLLKFNLFDVNIRIFFHVTVTVLTRGQIFVKYSIFLFDISLRNESLTAVRKCE